MDFIKSSNECISDRKIGKYTPVILYVVVREGADVNGQPELMAVLSFLCVEHGPNYLGFFAMCVLLESLFF